MQAASTGPAKYNGPIDCVKQLYREGGLRSIYRGTAATLLRGISSPRSLETIKQIQLLNLFL